MPGEVILNKKKEIVKEMAEKIRNAKGLVLADYRGLTVQQDTELRRALRAAGVEYRVVKNTLTMFAMKENKIEGIGKFLEGPTSIAMSETDPIAPAKVMSEFAGKFEKLEIKTGLLEGKVISVEGVNDLARLPSKEVLIARALGGMKAPLSGLVNVLNGNLRGLALVLNAIAEKKAG